MYVGGLQQGGGNPDPIPGYTTTNNTKKQANKIRDDPELVIVARKVTNNSLCTDSIKVMKHIHWHTHPGRPSYISLFHERVYVSVCVTVREGSPREGMRAEIEGGCGRGRTREPERTR